MLLFVEFVHLLALLVNSATHIFSTRIQISNSPVMLIKRLGRFLGCGVTTYKVRRSEGDPTKHQCAAQKLVDLTFNE